MYKKKKKKITIVRLDRQLVRLNFNDILSLSRLILILLKQIPEHEQHENGETSLSGDRDLEKVATHLKLVFLTSLLSTSRARGSARNASPCRLVCLLPAALVITSVAGRRITNYRITSTFRKSWGKLSKITRKVVLRLWPSVLISISIGTPTSPWWFVPRPPSSVFSRERLFELWIFGLV